MKYRINLLTLKKNNPVDKVFYFALNYLRYILVITQIVVIVVFFIRFKTDQEIVDLTEVIDQKKEIVEISQPLIKEANQTELKLTQINNIILKQQNFIQGIDYVTSIFPEEIFLKKYGFDNKGQTSLEGYSLQPNIIRKFYQKLKQDGKYKKVTLEYVKKVDLKYEFIINLS